MFKSEEEARFYNGIVHGLRMRDWSKSEAEGEALDRLLALRSKGDESPNPPSLPTA